MPIFFFYKSPTWPRVTSLKFQCCSLSWEYFVANTNWFSGFKCNVFCIISLVAIGRYRPPYLGLYVRGDGSFVFHLEWGCRY